VEIALATYQSEKYLRAQLSSLFGQSYQDFSILVADDGSTDGTVEILNEYANKYPGRVKLLHFQERAGSACRNFSRILDAARSNYVMFCDHDDVWLSDKIQASLSRMTDLEAEFGAEMPILVHTDLSVVDADLQMKFPSFAELERLSPHKTGFRELLVQNNVTGCTMLMNRALYRLARPIPFNAPMHDWWIALVASFFGKISFIAHPTILYRQHGANTVGVSKRRTWADWLMRGVNFVRGRNGRGRARLQRVTDQAGMLASMYETRLSPAQFGLLSEVAGLWSRPMIARVGVLIRNRLFALRTVRTVELLLGACSRR
jgi:glycosyltransferase involved in cell wall biosynthesis